MNGATLKQVEKFKYLGVAFTSDGRQDEKLDIQISKASAVINASFALFGCHETKIVKLAKLSIFKTIFVPILRASERGAEETMLPGPWTSGGPSRLH